MINPVLLRSFCSLVENGHFTRTAEKLNMTQSGVSQHVRKLEDHIDQLLLIRQGKKFVLTSAGKRLYQEGKKILVSLEDLENRVKLDPEFEGIVKLASPGSVGLKLYPHLLALQEKYPKLVIEYCFAPNSEIEKLLIENRIDFGLMTCSSRMVELKLKPIAKEELLLITPSDVVEASWENLHTLGFVNHPDGAYHSEQLLSVNFPEFQNCYQFKSSGFSNQINLILEPVSMGLGFTVLPNYAVAAFKERDKLKVHRLAHSVSETLYISQRETKFIPNSVKTVLSEILKCLKNVA